ncbi:MAG: PASTA domain-containing protein [Acidobacteriaceae bacterium]|nr:PASTA domain-containing protein [Acidobacteriaceae bacterium]
MKRFFRIAFTVIAMLATMMIAAGITLRLALHTGDTLIPSLSGLTVSEAADAALRAGLDLTIENKFYSTTVPAGRILSQAPAVGAQVRKGWQVRVTESLGPQQVTIPDVSAQPMRAATMTLRRASLDLGTIAHIEAPGDPDIVVAQTPPPDAGVDQPRVSLLVSSSGAGADGAFVLPSFLGMSYPAANRAAASLGLKTAWLGQTTSTISASSSLPPGAHTGPNGTILDASGEPIARPAQAAVSQPAQASGPSGPVLVQTPAAGYRANRGDTVKLTFAHVVEAVAAPVIVTPAATAAAPATGKTVTVPVPAKPAAPAKPATH